MKRPILSFVAMALFLALFAAPARADEGFGLKDFDVAFVSQDGSPAMQAGSHPFAFTTAFKANTASDGKGGEAPIDAVKDLLIELPEGIVGDPTAVARCPAVVFMSNTSEAPKCPNDTTLGKTTVTIGVKGQPEPFTQPIYNLAPPPGALLKLGFIVVSVPVTFEIGLKDTYPYNPVVNVSNISQGVSFYGAETTVWGNPASDAHDEERGPCLSSPAADSCPIATPERPFLTLPRSCSGPLSTLFEADSWQNPGAWLAFPPALTHDDSEPPSPLGLSGCGKLGFAPRIDSQPTTDNAESPSGLDFHLDVEDEGLISPEGIAQSDVKKAVVTLPEGITANPSLAEGLATCTEAGFAAEGLASAPGQGCPQASKLGTVEVETPLLQDALLKGQLFIASQNENPFKSLLALYMVIRDPGLGILVKLPGKVEPDPETGQLITTFGEAPYEIPQFPFSHFRFHFREGGRSPLITPPSCGTYTTVAKLFPWADPENPLTTTSSFKVTKGVAGGPCPPGGTPPFNPGFQAGTLNNAAGSHSPFYLRLTRRDGDQDLTRFSAKLPPGMIAKLAGTSQCSDAAIALAKAKSGKAELSSPSCPTSSQIGSVIGGAGVGSQLTYVKGSLYLAGAFNGAPLSTVAIVPAVAGPFDVGTVVVRQALRIDPRTAEVSVDGNASDPIPHILAGIPLKVRDVRASVDRPDFTLNPTSCETYATVAELWGGGADAFDSADDSSVGVSSRFQAAGCAALGFKPRLTLKLKGGTKRGAHPALAGTYRPRPGDANLSNLVLRLPRSAFLDQAHIRTICTRVQFAAAGGNGAGCPPGAIYGKATAHTPLLEEPLSGPVFLRSSDHNLPDFVAALEGLVDVEAVARIDSVKGGIRATFEDVPDAPLTKVVVQMQGAKKGLIVNSTDLCKARHKANARMVGQNGKAHNSKPAVRATRCGKNAKR